MNQYRNSKLPDSFQNMFKDVTTTDDVQTRHNDHKFSNQPALPQLEWFPLKCLINTWNSLDIDLKATSDQLEFESLLKESYLAKYSSEIQCDGLCYSCDNP